MTTLSTTSGRSRSTATAIDQPIDEPAAPAAPAITSAAAVPSRFTAIGALFQGWEQGELQLRLEPAFLSALGYPIHSGEQATLILKNRRSRHGRAYRSVFLAIEDS